MNQQLHNETNKKLNQNLAAFERKTAIGGDDAIESVRWTVPYNFLL